MMNPVQIKGDDDKISQALLDNIQAIKIELDSILAAADKTVMDNLLQESEILIERATDNSKTYFERHEIFNQINKSWFSVWEHYKNQPAAVELIRIIDRFTNFITAHSYLFLGLSQINENKTGEKKQDIKRVADGLLLVAEVIDVFVQMLPASELKQIYDGAKKTLSMSERSIVEYFAEELEISHAITQSKSYSSLIILKIEEYLKQSNFTQEIIAIEKSNDLENWIKSVGGTVKKTPEESAPSTAEILERIRNRPKINPVEQELPDSTDLIRETREDLFFEASDEEVWQAYLTSKQERKEVYRRLADS